MYMEKNSYVITKNNGVMAGTEAKESEIVREISSKEELEELIERIPFIQTIQAPNSKVRKSFYQTAMEKYDDLEWVSIIKSVHLRMAEGRYEQFEVDYLKKARKFLYGEISVQFGIPFEGVEKFLNETIEKQLKEF